MEDAPSNEAVCRKGAAARRARLPQIVPIVLQQAAKFLRNGEFSQAEFKQKLARLAAEELIPGGLELIVRDLPGGTMRFLITESRTGRICEMIDCASQPARPAKTKPEPAALPPLIMAWEPGS